MLITIMVGMCNPYCLARISK